jgi:Fic family protein
VYTEQDNNDFTYFLDYNVRKIEQALNDFKEYVKRKAKEYLVLHKNLKEGHNLNDRQVRTLQYIYANKGEFITTRSYKTINHISNPTAVSDVTMLVTEGFLRKEKIGREVKYYATNKIDTLFKL